MTERDPKIVVDGSTFDCAAVDAIQMPTIERILRGTTKADEVIDQMALPDRPIWLVLAIRSIRWYRSVIAPRLGHRCVFEPSCSHYAELAFRRRGFIIGGYLTCQRLLRCRPGRGGIDEFD